MPGEISKDKSPFYPGQPVPIELFEGRASQIRRIIQRGSGQVAAGKPVTMFVEGEYGIGKTSFAKYTQEVARRQHGLLPVYVTLGGCSTLPEMAQRVVEAVIQSGALDPSRMGKIRDLMGKYLGDQTFFGFGIKLSALQADAPMFSSPHGMLDMLRRVVEVWEIGGVHIILDEINGITQDPNFAHFIKGFVEVNALSERQTPVFLVLCGTPERRQDMIAHHQPVERVLDPVHIPLMSPDEMKSFFQRAFRAVPWTVDDEALDVLAHYSAGFPKIMHIIGDAAYWRDDDGHISRKDAIGAVVTASAEVGEKYVDRQVISALRSPDYREILNKVVEVVAEDDFNGLHFSRQKVIAALPEPQKGKVDNFLRRMRGLNVIRLGANQGEYCFIMRMVFIHLWLERSKPDAWPHGR